GAPGVEPRPRRRRPSGFFSPSGLPRLASASASPGVGLHDATPPRHAYLITLLPLGCSPPTLARRRCVILRANESRALCAVHARCRLQAAVCEEVQRQVAGEPTQMAEVQTAAAGGAAAVRARGVTGGPR